MSYERIPIEEVEKIEVGEWSITLYVSVFVPRLALLKLANKLH